MDACILQNILEKKEEKFDKIITKNYGEWWKNERREGFPIPRF